MSQRLCYKEINQNTCVVRVADMSQPQFIIGEAKRGDGCQATFFIGGRQKRRIAYTQPAIGGFSTAVRRQRGLWCFLIFALVYPRHF